MSAVPWAIMDPHGRILWIGMAETENCAWWYFLGWPDEAEIDERKAEGWRAAPAVVTIAERADQRPDTAAL